MTSKLDSQPRIESGPGREGGALAECPYGASGDTCVPIMHDYPCICELRERAEAAEVREDKQREELQQVCAELKAVEASEAKLREAFRQMIEREVTGACALSLQFDALQALKDKSNG